MLRRMLGGSVSTGILVRMEECSCTVVASKPIHSELHHFPSKEQADVNPGFCSFAYRGQIACGKLSDQREECRACQRTQCDHDGKCHEL